VIGFIIPLWQGYFLRVSPQTSMSVGELAKARRISVVLNLNSVWITETCKSQLMEMMGFVDYLIGNESVTLFPSSFFHSL